jgi:hypothetical protein
MLMMVVVVIWGGLTTFFCVSLGVGRACWEVLVDHGLVEGGGAGLVVVVVMVLAWWFEVGE